jgi:oligoendopeptidase F
MKSQAAKGMMNTSVFMEPDLEHARPYQPRCFVPQGARLTELDLVRSLYSDLEQRVIHAAGELEQWVLDRSELESVVSQEGMILYARMTCQTDDAPRAKAYAEFIETIIPAVKIFDNRLDRKYLEESARLGLDSKRYAVYTRAITSDVRLFAEQNVPLETKAELLSQEYQSVCGAMTVNFEGREQTLPQMAKFLLEPDRGLRERAWRASARRRLNDRERLDGIFDKMLALRHQIARNAGCKDFCDYKFQALHRFDYAPQDCKQYHHSIETLVVPLLGEILNQRRQRMSLDRLFPWDTSVDPLGRPPLKPFAHVSELIDGCQEIFNRLDRQFGGHFAGIAGSGFLDLESRKGKAPGGYQSALDEARQPFIFMNAVGTDADVRTLLHEAGHAFHSLGCAHDPLLNYRHGPMEFNEVASMGMELLAEKYLSVFYDIRNYERSCWDHLEGVIATLAWVAAIDAFQFWIYENPSHTAEQRREAWLKVHERFGGKFIDWHGLETEQEFLWHRQLHIFEVPFYYIEYGIAQLGALQLWLNAKRDERKTITLYKDALALGGSRPLPELYAAAGIRFDFSSSAIAPLVSAVRKELGL